MSSISQLEVLIERARQAGFIVRYEHLGGMGGGVCDYSGKRWIFIDLAQSTEESWETLRDALTEAMRSTIPSAASDHRLALPPAKITASDSIPKAA
jgi:hypothetical protein